MTQCKSIRKDDVNVTATQLGVEVGDKFIVLPRREQHKSPDSYSQHAYLSEGDVVVLTRDDKTPVPYFTNLATGEEDLAISFSRLALTKRSKKKKRTL